MSQVVPDSPSLISFHNPYKQDDTLATGDFALIEILTFQLSHSEIPIIAIYINSSTGHMKTNRQTAPLEHHRPEKR